MNQAVIVHQHSVSDIERMARGFAASKLFGVQNPEQALALCLIAQAEGRHPASAAQDYHIISGKPSKKADAMLRDFLAGGGKVEWHQLDDTKADATFSHPAGGSVRISWDHERAKQAQIKTPMWTKYPRQMLRARVVSEGVRTVFPMATSGMYVPEEVVEFTPTPANGEQAPVIEAQAISPENPDALPKAKTRETYAALQQELDACTTLDELAALWVSKPFQAEFKKLKSDWQDLLLQAKDALKDALTPQPGHVEPNFDEMEGAVE
jgi:hypothetical protein